MPATGDPCAIEDCDGTRVALGLCDMHYRRYKRNDGDPLYVTPREDWSPRDFYTETPTYAGMHSRIVLRRGKASGYMCVSCGNPAQEWACVRNKTTEADHVGVTVRFSTSIDDYDPMCRHCHSLLDAEAIRGEKAYQAILTEAIVRELRTRLAAGERLSPTTEGRRYGVAEGTMRDVLEGKTWKHVT